MKKYPLKIGDFAPTGWLPHRPFFFSEN